MGLKEYTGEVGGLFGKRPAKVFIGQEDGSQKNWEWDEFRKRYNRMVEETVKLTIEEAVNLTIEAVIEYLRPRASRASSPEEAAKIAIDEVRRKRGGPIGWEAVKKKRSELRERGRRPT